MRTPLAYFNSANDNVRTPLAYFKRAAAAESKRRTGSWLEKEKFVSSVCQWFAKSSLTIADLTRMDIKYYREHVCMRAQSGWANSYRGKIPLVKLSSCMRIFDEMRNNMLNDDKVRGGIRRDESDDDDEYVELSSATDADGERSSDTSVEEWIPESNKCMCIVWHLVPYRKG